MASPGSMAVWTSKGTNLDRAKRIAFTLASFLSETVLYTARFCDVLGMVPHGGPWLI